MPFEISPPKLYQFKILCEDNFSPILKFFGPLNLNFQPKLEKSKNGASGVNFQNFFEKKFFGEVLDQFESLTGRNLKYL